MYFNISDIKTYNIDESYKQCFSNIKNSVEYSLAIDYMLERFDKNIVKEICLFLYKFKFATKKQIINVISKKYNISIDFNFQELVDFDFFKDFILVKGFVDEEYERNEENTIYAIGPNGVNLLIEYFNIEVPRWEFRNISRSADKVIKSLQVVDIYINMMESFKDFNKSLSTLGDIPVVTFANRFYDVNKLALKRIIDIVGSLVGIVITLILSIFIAPAILIESRGPLIFKQKRVGKNGRFFYVYKFRSMYKDAEERKKALMEKNEMKGHMFKMTDDPRITKVGKFIRKTSLDELPQFFNVLIGDMSLVGTRPPTVEEFKEYEGYHKRRLSMKPGITGMWQVSGRSNIEDFEDVVRLDLEYIDKWSIGLDFKILLKTVGVIFTRGGAK